MKSRRQIGVQGTVTIKFHVNDYYSGRTRIEAINEAILSLNTEYGDYEILSEELMTDEDEPICEGSI